LIAVHFLREVLSLLPYSLEKPVSVSLLCGGDVTTETSEVTVLLSIHWSHQRMGLLLTDNKRLQRNQGTRSRGLERERNRCGLGRKLHLMVTRFGFFRSLWFASSRSAGIVFLSKLVINLSEQVLRECSEEIPSEIQGLEHISVLVGSLGNELTLRDNVRDIGREEG
jgi:hypothetical protein